MVREGDPSVPPLTIRVCDGIACAMAGAGALLAGVMRDASICGLGQAAANPLTSLIRYFPDLFPTPAPMAAE